MVPGDERAHPVGELPQRQHPGTDRIVRRPVRGPARPRQRGGVLRWGRHTARSGRCWCSRAEPSVCSSPRVKASPRWAPRIGATSLRRGRGGGPAVPEACGVATGRPGPRPPRRRGSGRSEADHGDRERQRPDPAGQPVVAGVRDPQHLRREHRVGGDRPGELLHRDVRVLARWSTSGGRLRAGGQLLVLCEQRVCGVDAHRSPRRLVGRFGPGRPAAPASRIAGLRPWRRT